MRVCWERGDGQSLQLTWAPSRTIHGLVYNAMKLFMEIDHQLFDECSRRYAESQETADERERARLQRWDVLAEQARRKQPGGAGTVSPTPRPAVGTSTTGADDVDPITHDSQKRLDALRLQDEVAASKDYWDGAERRPRDPDRQHPGNARGGLR